MGSKIETDIRRKTKVGVQFFRILGLVFCGTDLGVF